jgi:hypothetical protein
VLGLLAVVAALAYTLLELQAAWLLHTRTLPALEPEDIQPKAELRHARQARAVLDGTREGLALARRRRVRLPAGRPDVHRYARATHENRRR